MTDSVMEDKDVADDPVTHRFCEERSQRVLDSLDAFNERLDVVLNNHDRRIGDVENICEDVGPLKQQVQDGVLGRDFSNKRVVVGVLIITVVVNFFSNLDKIANIWR